MSDESEDDLGRELLQAVGHAGSKKAAGGAVAGRRRPRKPNKSRRRSSDEEDEEDDSSEEDDSDDEGGEDEDDEEEWGDGAKGKGKGKEKDDDGFTGSKAKSTFMPFKKRFDTGMVPEEPQSASKRSAGAEDRDDEEAEEGRRRDDGGGAMSDSGSELSFGSEGDLYKDDEDRERLEAMNELKREEILYERGERRDAHNERKKIREKIRSKKQAKEDEEELRRTPSRPKKNETEVTPMSWRRGSLQHKTKDAALQKLEAAKAKKEQKRQDSSQKRRREEEEEEEEEEKARKKRDKRRDDDRRAESEEDYADEAEEEEEEEDEDEEEEEEEERGPQRRRARDDESEDRDEEEDDRRREDEDMDEEDDEERAKEEQADVGDLQRIVLTRSRLSQWCMEPFFDKVVTGSYVRLGIGVNKQGENVYRVCEVLGVDDRDATKQYKLDNRMICKFLDCQWGEHRARWQMARVSDKPPTKEEILQLFRQVDRAPGLRRLSKTEVQRKVEDMEKAKAFVYTPAVVRGMVEQKRQASNRPTNLLYEKDRLRISIAAALERDDEAEVQRLQEELMRIEKLEEERLESLQKATKKETLGMMNKRNRTENYKNASIGGKAAMEASQADTDLNPFARRWTRSQNYYKPVEVKPEKPAEPPLGSVKEEGPEGKGKEEADVVPLQSLPSLRKHDFEIDIDLSLLASWGGAAGWPDAFMARKQRQERVYGAPTACQDGRRHTQTLSMNDYKRRRGLL